MMSSLLISKFNRALGNLFDANAPVYDSWVDVLFNADGSWVDEEVLKKISI